MFDIDERIRSLNRYSVKCVSDRLDPDFATALEDLKIAFRDCRNELCEKCGKYKESHNGACDGCKWKD